MNAKKVVHVSHRFWPCLGGIETHVRQLCESLKDRDIEASVVCLNKCPNSKKVLPGLDRLAGTKIRRLGFLDFGFYRMAPTVIGQVADCDIVHVHGLGFFSDFLALTKFLHRKKLVLSSHGGVFHTKELSLVKKAYFFVWSRLALKAFDKVVAVSKQDYRLFKKIVPEKRLVLIENPVDVKRLQQGKIMERSDDLLFVGRFSKNKGLPELFEALAVVKKKRPDFKMMVVGKEFDLSKAELEARANLLGLAKNVRVLGCVSDKRLQQIYAKSGVFVSASRYEGFGISGIEAMAAGLLPVLNDIGPFKGFVREGENGFISDFSNKQKAAETILKALALSKAEKNRMRNNARKSAERFSWKNNIAKFEGLYNGLLVQR